MARAFLEWAIDLIGARRWEARREKLLPLLTSGGTLRLPSVQRAAGTSTVPDDLAAWYLIQIERWLGDTASYDVMSGSRFMPIVQRLGQSLDALKKVGGAQTRMRQMLRKAPREVDSVLFELLVAVTYQERTAGPVAFIPETSSKTPDLRVGDANDPFLVECKRKFRTNDYAREEYRRFAILFEPVRSALKRAQSSWALDFVFHRPMDTYDDDYLTRRVVPLLDLADADTRSWHVMIDDPELRVMVRAADWSRYARELGHVDVRGETPQLYSVLFDHYDPSRGYECSVAGEPSRQGPGLWSHLAFACVGIWSCDAPESVQAKTRHQQAELRKAFAQLSPDVRGAVHVANETYDDQGLADERRRRIAEDLWTGLDPAWRERKWVYLHLFAFDVPPNESWSAEETCVHFTPSDPAARAFGLTPKLLLQPSIPYPNVPRIRFDTRG